MDVSVAWRAHREGGKWKFTEDPHDNWNIVQTDCFQDFAIASAARLAVRDRGYDEGRRSQWAEVELRVPWAPRAAMKPVGRTTPQGFHYMVEAGPAVGTWRLKARIYADGFVGKITVEQTYGHRPMASGTLTMGVGGQARVTWYIGLVPVGFSHRMCDRFSFDE